jgi:uncharacterized protein (UPF0371 family)
VWNLPLKHPVNLAYEAATADLNDVNMLDPYHLEAYGKTAVNYNRDVEIFPVLAAMFEKISGSCPYKSPTDMGVNMAGFCIYDNDNVCEASNFEIIRRYYACACSKRKGLSDGVDMDKIEIIMNNAGITVNDRKVIPAALKKAEETGEPACAIELPDGRIITGKTTKLLGASSAMLLNALKALAGIADDIHLISPEVIEPISMLKTGHLHCHNPRLHTDEILIALSICALTNDFAKRALGELHNLKDCEAHSTVILSPVDESVMKKLGIYMTSEPRYQSKKLFHKN